MITVNLLEGYFFEGEFFFYILWRFYDKYKLTKKQQIYYLSSFRKVSCLIWVPIKAFCSRLINSTSTIAITIKP